jgi:hypothetical protein
MGKVSQEFIERMRNTILGCLSAKFLSLSLSLSARTPQLPCGIEIATAINCFRSDHMVFKIADKAIVKSTMASQLNISIFQFRAFR